MNIIDLSGSWKVRIDDGKIYAASLPGTLDENGIGYKDSGANQWMAGEGTELYPEVITTRLTRKYTYEGPAFYSKELFTGGGFGRGERVFLEVERSRKLSLSIDGQAVKEYQRGTVSTPYRYEVTGMLAEGSQIELVCDNSYPGWPHDAIVYSSAATDETQTNWNGMLGFIRLRTEKQVFFSKVRIYPGGGSLTVHVDIDAGVPYEGVIRLNSPAFDYSALNSTVINCDALNCTALDCAALDCAALDCGAQEGGSILEHKIALAAGQHTLSFENIPVSPECKLWDEYEGHLYELQVSADGLDSRTETFGIRDFGDNGQGRLALNRRIIFLRSEANCCVFPETGHMPFTTEEWMKVLKCYKEYGINCLRFHSHCPPSAAFAAADKLGILLQPELSHWNPKDAFEARESWDYYQLELQQILLTYANHPSFVMLTFGNELHTGELGQERMKQLLAEAKKLDHTRLYAIGSNAFYGNRGADAESDFYTSSNYYDKMLRGTSSPMSGYINHSYPGTGTNFDLVMEELRGKYKKPVFSFEVGQYEVLPDFEEIKEYKAVTIPDNLTYIKEQVTKKGLLKEWRKRVEATGELALLAYREEVEAVLRTGGLSGISLLGLQDFPGQGTALVGMLNSHLEPKPYAFARPERFRSFFSEVVPLVCMERYTYTVKDTLTAEIKLANYGKADITAAASYELSAADTVLLRGELPEVTFPCGKVTMAGNIGLRLQEVDTPGKLTLKVMIHGYKNEYPVWVYSAQERELPSGGIVIATVWSEAAQALERGARVLYSPKADEEHFPSSVQAQFTTDFWSVGTFADQSGCMGCLMDPAHPVFEEFPTEAHSDWQWWPMSNGRAVILPDIMEEPIITVIDCYARLRKLAFLFEAKVGNGRLMVSSMGLLEKQEYPEARALTNSILGYMASELFDPKQSIELETLLELLK